MIINIIQQELDKYTSENSILNSDYKTNIHNNTPKLNFQHIKYSNLLLQSENIKDNEQLDIVENNESPYKFKKNEVSSLSYNSNYLSIQNRINNNKTNDYKKLTNSIKDNTPKELTFKNDYKEDSFLQDSKQFISPIKFNKFKVINKNCLDDLKVVDSGNLFIENNKYTESNSSDNKNLSILFSSCIITPNNKNLICNNSSNKELNNFKRNSEKCNTKGTTFSSFKNTLNKLNKYINKKDSTTITEEINNCNNKLIHNDIYSNISPIKVNNLSYEKLINTNNIVNNKRSSDYLNLDENSKTNSYKNIKFNGSKLTNNNDLNSIYNFIDAKFENLKSDTMKILNNHLNNNSLKLNKNKISKEIVFDNKVCSFILTEESNKLPNLNCNLFDNYKLNSNSLNKNNNLLTNSLNYTKNNYTNFSNIKRIDIKQSSHKFSNSNNTSLLSNNSLVNENLKNKNTMLFKKIIKLNKSKSKYSTINNLKTENAISDNNKYNYLNFDTDYNNIKEKLRNIKKSICNKNIEESIIHKMSNGDEAKSLFLKNLNILIDKENNNKLNNTINNKTTNNCSINSKSLIYKKNTISESNCFNNKKRHTLSIAKSVNVVETSNINNFKSNKYCEIKPFNLNFNIYQTYSLNSTNLKSKSTCKKNGGLNVRKMYDYSVPKNFSTTKNKAKRIVDTDKKNCLDKSFKNKNGKVIIPKFPVANNIIKNNKLN